MNGYWIADLSNMTSEIRKYLECAEILAKQHLSEFHSYDVCLQAKGCPLEY